MVILNCLVAHALSISWQHTPYPTCASRQLTSANCLETLSRTFSFGKHANVLQSEKATLIAAAKTLDRHLYNNIRIRYTGENSCLRTMDSRELTLMRGQTDRSTSYYSKYIEIICASTTCTTLCICCYSSSNTKLHCRPREMIESSVDSHWWRARDIRSSPAILKGSPQWASSFMITTLEAYLSFVNRWDLVSPESKCFPWYPGTAVLRKSI